MNPESGKFPILLEGTAVKTPIALASMAGIVDARYALERKEHIGAAFLGGYSIDTATIAAGRELAESGRSEFLPDEPFDEISSQAAAMHGSGVVTGINLRATHPEPFLEAVFALGDKVIYEIDAHCRQEPVIRAGSGEYLLNHPENLKEIIKALKKEGVTVSVKIRAGVSKNDMLLVKSIWNAGADICHVDLMDFGYQRLRQIRNTVPMIIIANNSINTSHMMKEMLSHGADMVSVARHSDIKTLEALDEWVHNNADVHGWFNAPKQLCRGGDIRALAFCCMPVKECPLIPFLKRINISPREYMDLKIELVKGTPLEKGKETCFGSLAWCCKDSSPCMFRDMTIRDQKIPMVSYMKMKQELSVKILDYVFSKDAVPNES